MHGNARLTHWGRQELVDRVLKGTPIAHVAIEMNVSRPTADKWVRRHAADPDGEWWLDRSSRPHTCPHQTPALVEARIVQLRTTKKLGPARIAGQLGMRGAAPAATPLTQAYPAFAADAQVWVRHALSLIEGDKLQLRYTTIDNAPKGREVHWNSAWAWAIAWRWAT